jgi:hypothetical protein
MFVDQAQAYLNSLLSCCLRTSGSSTHSQSSTLQPWRCTSSRTLPSVDGITSNESFHTTECISRWNHVRGTTQAYLCSMLSCHLRGEWVVGVFSVINSSIVAMQSRTLPLVDGIDSNQTFYTTRRMSRKKHVRRRLSWSNETTGDASKAPESSPSAFHSRRGRASSSIF